MTWFLIVVTFASFLPPAFFILCMIFFPSDFDFLNLFPLNFLIFEPSLVGFCLHSFNFWSSFSLSVDTIYSRVMEFFLTNIIASFRCYKILGRAFNNMIALYHIYILKIIQGFVELIQLITNFPLLRELVRIRLLLHIQPIREGFSHVHTLQF